MTRKIGDIQKAGRVRQSCSLMRHLRIERSDQSAWRELAEFHYRQRGLAVVDKVFAVRWSGGMLEGGWDKLVGKGEPVVGVIVYGMPVPSVSLRNHATQNRYSGWTDRAAALRLLSREMRCINRVVIRPEFRGIGLGRHLVEQTLPLVGTPLVEALAVMARVNPFFERAGMTRYDGPRSRSSERMLEAFGHVSIDKAMLNDRSGLRVAMAKLPEKQRQWIVREMRRFAQPSLKNRVVGFQSVEEEVAYYANFVIEHALSRPVYFLWQR